MTLTEPNKKYLRGLGHQLKPVVLVGDAGLTDGVRSEVETALQHHELIKIKLRVGDRQKRDGIIDTLCADSAAVLVQRVGNTALLYRENPERKKIRLPHAQA